MLTRRYADLSTGIRMSYLIKQGDDSLPTVIFIHGHLMTSDTVAEFLEMMDKPNTFIAPDLRSSWQNVTLEFAKVADKKDYPNNISWVIKDGHTIDSYANDILDLINQLKLKKPFIMGGSLGSAVSLSLSKKLGDNISGLVLICPVCKFVYNFRTWIGGLAAKIMARTKSIPGCAEYVSKLTFQKWPAKHKWFYEIIAAHSRTLIVKSSDAIINFNARRNLGLQDNKKWANPPFEYMVIYGTKDGLVYPKQVEVCKSIFDLEEGKNLFGFEQDHNLPYYIPEVIKKLTGDFIGSN